MGLTNVRCFEEKCFMNICGVSCRLLDKPITKHKCPFFKTDEELREGQKAAIKRLEDLGLYGLIETYIYNSKRNC